MNNQGTLIEKQSKTRSLFKQSMLLLQVLLGSVFLGLMAQISVPLPFTPVPFSLQTLGVALLAISLGSRKAPLAVMAYLLQATLGFPVIAGGLSKPLWMISPTAGYLIAFVISSFLTAKLLERARSSSWIKTWLAFTVNEVTILLIGSLWLALFVGGSKAFLLGALPFIPGALVKIAVAASSVKPIRWIKSKM
jgi:biotin transport system substrate-specific component